MCIRDSANTPAEWNAVIDAWQRWNAEHGGNLPTIISEAGSGQELHDYLSTWQRDGILAVYWFGINEATQVNGENVLSSEWQYLPALTGD